MSLVEDNKQTESEIVNVEDILATFFLKKIDMKSSKSESYNKYKKKSKHKKHKSKKHKHKSSRRYNNSERRNSNSLSIGCTSSSEEKDIKRLKKLKKLDVKDQSKLSSFLPVPLSTQNILSSTDNFVQNNTASDKTDIPYGPSLELLLSGADFESKKQSVLSLVQSEESSSHQLSSIPACSYANPKLLGELSSSSKELEALKLIENARMECQENAGMKCKEENAIMECKEENAIMEHKEENARIESKEESAIMECKKENARKECQEESAGMEYKEENVLSDEISSIKLLKTSKQCEEVTELEAPSINFVVKQESSDKKEKKRKEKSQSRSRSESKPRKRSRSRSCTSRSRSRKRYKSRSRSNYRSRKERSYSRDHSKSKHSSQSKTRRSRSRHRSKKSRSRSHSLRRRRRSRSWSYSKDYARSRHEEKRRSRSVGRRYRSRSHSKEHGSRRSRRESSYDRSNRKRKSSSERELKSKQKSRSKSKEKYSSSKSCKIDQAKIREIAEKNVLHMIQQGTLPEGISLENFKKKELVSIKAGGKSVQELTDFCAKLSKKENEVHDDSHDANDVSNLEGENAFIHHPFKLKEQSMIKLNIKNAVQIPVKTHAEKFAETAKLSSQFPVSSGNQHKQKELEWIPVVPEENRNDLKVNEIKSVVPIESTPSAVKLVAPKAVETAASIVAPLPISSDIPSIPLPPTPNQPLPPPPLPPLPPSIPPLPIPPVPPFQLLSANLAIKTSEVKVPCANNTASQSVSYPALPLPSSLPVPTCNSSQTSTEPSRSFFSKPAASTSTSQIDFTSVFSKKFHAEKKLQTDPNNAEALKAIQEAEAAFQEWVNSCKVPGMFYGSTHVKPLPREQLGGLKDYRVKRDTFTRAAPVTEGKGMSLLKKMGWNPGEGLGKNKEGSLVPLIIDIKMDKKGLVSEGESGKNNITNAVKELQGKHPVSALMELCSKRKWKPPLYTIIKDAGPPHKKQFLFKVEVNGVDYQPVMPSSNKKVAKADAAIVCLQALKVFPT